MIIYEYELIPFFIIMRIDEYKVKTILFLSGEITERHLFLLVRITPIQPGYPKEGLNDR
jgi:hypothetical protein